MWVFESLEVREIARLSGVSRAAVSGVVTTLERDGWAQRTRDQADGRLATVRVTPAGRELLATAYARQHEVERSRFGAIDPDDLAVFTSVLRSLLHEPPDGGDR